MDSYQRALSHFGIPGMHWGQRKASSKEIKKTHSEILKAETKKALEESGLNKKKQEALDFGKKNKLDLDDGGGGTFAAGRKYNKMWEDIDALEEHVSSTASRNARTKMVEKYGQTRIDSFNKTENVKSIATGAAVVTSLLAVPVAISVIRRSIS